MTRKPPTVIVLAKEPVPGRVKTRLCPPCTPVEAATIARGRVADTVAAAISIDGARPLLVLDGRTGPWLDAAIPTVAQTGDTFNDRLAAAFAHVDGPAVLIGMDTPQVTGAQIGDVLATLRRTDADAVLGLTPDGGWWIIGFDRPVPHAFRGVPMSTPTTGRRQRAQLDGLNLRTASVPPVTDVDTFADATAVAAAFPDLGFSAAVRRVAARRVPIDVPA